MTLRAIVCGLVKRWPSRAGWDFDALMKQLRHIKADRTFTRDEMNVR
jgi:hypothetical protein